MFTANLDSPADWVNFCIAAVTWIAALYTAPLYIFWWIRLRKSTAKLRPLILVLAMFAVCVLLWSSTGIYQLTVLDQALPPVSLPVRMLFMCCMWVTTIITLSVRPPSQHDYLPGPWGSNEVKTKVLVVDDNARSANTFCSALAAANFAAAPVGTAELAMLWVEEYDPDALIVDIILPGISGIEMMKLLRAKGYKGLAIAISGDIDATDPKLFYKFMPKPIRIAELIEVVKEGLAVRGVKSVA